MPLVAIPVLDHIRSLGPDGATLLARLVDLFSEHAPRLLQTIRAEVTRGDAPAIATAAHALKSLCVNIGARRAGAICDHVEELAANDHPVILDQIAHLEQVVTASIQDLEAMVATPEPVSDGRQAS
jgi:HPt (histidine-containing phosphotransfer) domain-containing protein